MYMYIVLNARKSKWYICVHFNDPLLLPLTFFHSFSKKLHFQNLGVERSLAYFSITHCLFHSLFVLSSLLSNKYYIVGKGLSPRVTRNYLYNLAPLRKWSLKWRNYQSRWKMIVAEILSSFIVRWNTIYPLISRQISLSPP